MGRCNDRGDVNWVGRLVLQKQKKSSFDDIIERSHKYLSVEEVVDKRVPEAQASKSADGAALGHKHRNQRRA